MKRNVMGAAAGVEETPPPASRYVLPSGRVIEWRQPDVFAMIAFTGLVPNAITGAVIKLLLNEGSYTPEDDPRYFVAKAEQLRGMYGIVAAGMVSPRLDINKQWGDGDGVIGRNELTKGDLEYAYHLLFCTGGAGVDPLADPVDARGPAGATPDRGDVSPDASAANGD